MLGQSLAYDHFHVVIADPCGDCGHADTTGQNMFA